MPFRPLNEGEIKDMERQISILENEITMRQHGITNLKAMIHDGAWVSETTFASNGTAE
jgi:hypothetical protein